MTRETKIGMLVGLAFIIVIGILLSDHMTSTTEPAKAPLSSAGSEVRSGVTTPAAAPVANRVAVAVPPTAPSTPVPTQDELASRNVTPPVQNIAVGPGSNVGQGQPIVIQQSNPVGTGPIVQTPPTGFGSDQPNTVAANGPTGSDDLDRWATKPPTEMTPVGHDATHPTSLVAANAPHPNAGGKEYTVESGDTLSKLAGRFMGGNTKTNRDAIVEANPSLKKDPNRLIVGKVYIIPTVAGAKPATATNTTPPTTVAKPGAAKSAADVFAEATTPVKPSGTGAVAVASADAGKGLSWYTVSEGDNLWKIAAEQLGSGNDWTKIKDLNKDVLKGGDTVHPNMRLRIPQKGVASAN